jgi:hypothetical protein
MINDIKKLLEAAILDNQNCVYFAPDSQGTYTIIFGDSSVYDVIVENGQELMNAIIANKKDYAFDVASTPYVLYASTENPYITLMNIKEKK